MTEPDLVWEQRKLRHITQMAIQNEVMTTCPDDVFPMQRGCLPQCRKNLETFPDCPPHVFWQVHYEPSFGCVFEERVGNAGEGGKWVCDPQRIKEKAETDGCLVYSIGSNGQFDFEESVHGSISRKCEIHTIDVNPWQYYKSRPP